jgi:hypothetical protein
LNIIPVEHCYLYYNFSNIIYIIFILFLLYIYIKSIPIHRRTYFSPFFYIYSCISVLTFFFVCTSFHFNEQTENKCPYCMYSPILVLKVDFFFFVKNSLTGVKWNEGHDMRIPHWSILRRWKKTIFPAKWAVCVCVCVRVWNAFILQIHKIIDECKKTWTIEANQT